MDTRLHFPVYLVFGANALCVGGPDSQVIFALRFDCCGYFFEIFNFLPETRGSSGHAGRRAPNLEKVFAAIEAERKNYLGTKASLNRGRKPTEEIALKYVTVSVRGTSAFASARCATLRLARSLSRRAWPAAAHVV